MCIELHGITNIGGSGIQANVFNVLLCDRNGSLLLKNVSTLLAPITYLEKCLYMCNCSHKFFFYFEC